MKRLAAFGFYSLFLAFHEAAMFVGDVLPPPLHLRAYDLLCAASWRVLAVGGRVLRRMA